MRKTVSCPAPDKESTGLGSNGYGAGVDARTRWRCGRICGKTGAWIISSTCTRTQNLAKPNFEFQKRQKELEKKRRKEEKKQKKLDRAAAQAPGGAESPPAETS